MAYAGPSEKYVIRGWDAVKKQWDTTWARLPQRTVAITRSKIEVRGALAWEIGNENGTVKTLDGSERQIDVIVTNIYEKIDGKWLMVSHQAQPKPQ